MTGPIVRTTPAVMTMLAASIATAAFGHYSKDIGLVVEAGSIRTAPADTEGFGPPQRAFTGNFGIDGWPWFAGNPGFEAAPGTFSAEMSVGVRFAAPLMVWDGTGFVANPPSGPTSSERLRLSYLALKAVTEDGPAPGFDLAVNPDGGLDFRPMMELLPAPGASEPRPGVYLLQLEIYATDPAINPSQPLWLVLNAGADDAEHKAAYAFARDQVDRQPCQGDLDADHAIDGNDLGLLLAGWGVAGPADLDADGVTDGNDLGLLLAAWGPCP